MTAAFVREVSAVSKSASNKSTLPILRNILIEATDAGLYLSATNLKTRLRAFVPGKVEEQGRTTVDIKTLQHLLGQFGKETKTALMLDGDRLFVGDTEGATGRLPVIDAEEMPTMPDFEKWPIVALIEPDVLKDRIERAIPFCSTDEARPILTGVYIQAKADKLTFGAANNYVVCGSDADAVVSVPDANAVVPATSLKLLASLLDTETVAYRKDPNSPNVAFTFANYVLLSRAIDGMYPNYEQVIPVRNADSFTVTLDRKELLKALKIARKGDFVRLVTGPAALAVEVHDGKEALFAKTIPAEIVPTRDEVSGFNPTLLVLALNSASASTVTLYRKSASVNEVVGIDTGDPQYRYAVMPVKLA
jgi:DNA polymerase-3 subunit beta